ncbi:DUF4199 domain-containing protein [Fulvivirga sp. M361]|uniref:DUF4199 domain-containing protein n=1 Tax=Fulvivirga sp. M361 TaxID=2594266 RepID=UPI0016293174|nr:DUF4199 domain-containing protein [Fulvivirga sp. M361]
MNRLPSLVKIPLKYALVASVLAIAVILLLFYTNRHPLLIPVFYDYRILLFGVFIFFSMKEFKEQHAFGVLHFWQGFLIGIFFYLVLGIVVGIFIFGFGHMEVSFLHDYVEGAIRGLELNRDQLTSQSAITITPEQFDHQITLMKSTKPYQMALDYFIKSCLIGFFLSILLAIILRRTDIKT